MWTVNRLFDGKWSVRLNGEEVYILPSTFSRGQAEEVGKMLNSILRVKKEDR